MNIYIDRIDRTWLDIKTNLLKNNYTDALKGLIQLKPDVHALKRLVSQRNAV